jgi:imidazolonepropionase-like amidohydrolase
MDEATAEMMAAKGIWLSFQPFLDDEGASPVPPDSRSRQLQVFEGTEKTMALAKKYKLKVAFGTDILFSEKVATRQGAELAKMRKWYSPADVLLMATSTNAQLLKLSGPRNPYPGNLGVVAEGALADLLLVNGDPIANIDLIAQPEKSFVVIMKDGKIYKNILNGEH